MNIRLLRPSLRSRIIVWSVIPTTIILIAIALVIFYAMHKESRLELLVVSQNYGELLTLLLVLGLIVPALVVAFAVKRITDPIRQLTEVAREVANGKFGQEIVIHGGDELEALVVQFNQMSKKLDESYTALKEREERLALVIEGTNDGIWDRNLKTNETYLSARGSESKDE